MRISEIDATSAPSSDLNDVAARQNTGYGQQRTRFQTRR